MIIRTIYNGAPCLLALLQIGFLAPREGDPTKTFVRMSDGTNIVVDEPFEVIVEKVRDSGVPNGDALLDLSGPVGGLTAVANTEPQRKKGKRQ